MRILITSAADDVKELTAALEKEGASVSHLPLVASTPLEADLATALDGAQGLLVTTPERVKVIKDVPTAKEAGRPDLELAIGWSALYGPPKMPKEIVAKWVDVLQKVKGDKSWNKMTTKLGSIPAISSPQEMEKFAESQFKAMRKVAEKVGMVIKKK